MPQTTNAFAQIEKLQKEIAALQVEGAKSLRARREALVQELAQVDARIAELTGVAPQSGQPKAAKALTGKSIPLQELKALLAAAPDKTLSIRKEGLQLENIKTLARVNPHLLQLGGKGAWPTVTMLK
jgi:hypothetical protein